MDATHLELQTILKKTEKCLHKIKFMNKSVHFCLVLFVICIKEKNGNLKTQNPLPPVLKVSENTSFLISLGIPLCL